MAKAVNRKRVQRLMRKMRIAALGAKPIVTKPPPGHKIFPYLLRRRVIDRPNQVWPAAQAPRFKDPSKRDRCASTCWRNAAWGHHSQLSILVVSTFGPPCRLILAYPIQISERAFGDQGRRPNACSAGQCAGAQFK